MDLSPVWQAEPPLVAGLILVLAGLLLPGALKRVTLFAGGLLALGALAFGVLYAGLAYACEAWDQHPQETWIGLIALTSLSITSLAAKSGRKHKHRHDDDEEDDDGGLRVHSPKAPPPAAPAPAPAPAGPTLDWSDFDDARREWERTPVGV